MTALGDATVSIAVPFLALASSPDAPTQAVGSVVLAGSLPRFLGPVLGSVADRVSPRPLLLLTSLLRAATVGGLAVLALGGAVPLTLLLLGAFLNGLLTTLAYTAGSTFIPRLVDPMQLTRANSLNSGAMMGVPLVGYGLGGSLLHLSGQAGTLGLSALFLLGLALAAPALPRMPAAQQGAPMRPLADLREGWRVLRTSRQLLAMLALSFTLNLVMSLINVRAPVHMQRLGHGAADYAVFEMLLAGGVLLGILLVTPLERRWSLDMLMGWGRWVLTLGTAGLVWPAVGVWWSAALVFGVGLGLLEVAAVTRSQHLVPLVLRGRVIGTLLALNAVGLSLGATLAAWPVATPWLMAGLSGTLLLLALSWPYAVQRSGDTQLQA